MTHAFSLRLTVSLGSRSATLTLPALAALLGAEAAARLVGLALGSARHEDIHNLNEERGGRGSMEPPAGTRTKNGIERELSEPVQTVPGDEGSRGEEGAAAVDNVASYLADALEDPRSLRFFRLVAANVPGDVIRECLTRARDIPRRDIRRSRAAVFTKLVLPHLKHCHREHAYA
jgi:hypothetical protein